MTKNVGLWMDREKAVIVSITDQTTDTKVIISRAGDRPKPIDESLTIGKSEEYYALANERRQDTYTGNLNIYYNAIIACLRDANSILIIGPEDAKTKLRERLKLEKLVGRISGFETVDKMPDRKIKDKVQKHFLTLVA